MSAPPSATSPTCPARAWRSTSTTGSSPTYELTPRGKDVVKELRSALKDASELYLATDEDREGEAISWHLLEAPQAEGAGEADGLPRDHPSAIAEAVANPRDIDYGLVDAAETRRILDRLYGYEVSPVLWRRVNRGLSAGRVQSPAIRLDRGARARADGVPGRPATGTSTRSMASDPVFTATLVGVDGTQGGHREGLRQPDGRPPGQVVVLDEAAARQLAEGLDGRDAHRAQRRGAALPSSARRRRS